MVRSWVSKGSSDMSLLTSFGFNSGWLVVMAVQMLSTLNRNRMSCNACLSAGKVSMNDTDDTDDSWETIKLNAKRSDARKIQLDESMRTQKRDHVRNFSCIAASNLTPGYS